MTDILIYIAILLFIVSRLGRFSRECDRDIEHMIEEHSKGVHATPKIKVRGYGRTAMFFRSLSIRRFTWLGRAAAYFGKIFRPVN